VKLTRWASTDTANDTVTPPPDVLAPWALGLSCPQFERCPSVSNDVWKILGKNTALVLKRYRYLTPRGVAKMHEVLELVRRAGILVPVPVRTQNGKSLIVADHRPYDLSEHIDSIPPAVLEKSPRMLHRAGEILGRIHSIELDAKISVAVPPDSRQRQNAILANQTAFLTSLPTLRRVCPRGLRSHLDAIPRHIAFLEPLQDQAIVDLEDLRGSPVGLVHGDYSPANLLVHPKDGSTHVIDWEYVRLEPTVWELQRALSFFCGLATVNVHLSRLTNMDYPAIFLSGYRRYYAAKLDLFPRLSICATYNATVGWLDYTLRRALLHDFRSLAFVPLDIDKSYWDAYLPSLERLYCSIWEQSATAERRLLQLTFLHRSPRSYRTLAPIHSGPAP